jgi:hypothetical protein
MDRQYVGIDFHRRRSVIVRKNARQALQARCLNELVLDIAPVVLRDGERIFDDVPEFDADRRGSHLAAGDPHRLQDQLFGLTRLTRTS